MRNTLLGLSLLLGGGTAAAFQQTVIPCGINNGTTSSCTITAATQLVTLSRSTATTTATVTSSLAARRVGKVVVPAYSEKYVIAPYQELGPLAMANYDGSGMCGRCDPPENDLYVQTVSIVECSSNARQSTKVCRQYKETWSRTAQGAKAPCTLTATTRYRAPTAGSYTFTFTGTAPPTYTVVPPSINTVTGRNGRVTYKVIKPKTIWYQPQPYNVQLTTIINNGGTINIQTTITTIVSVFLPTTTVTATNTVTFTNTTPGQVQTTTSRQVQTTTSRRTSTSGNPTTSASTTGPAVATGTPSNFYIQAQDPASNDVYYVRFVNNEAQLVTLIDALANGADTFSLPYGFLQNLKTTQSGGIGPNGTYLAGTSSTDNTVPVSQFNSFPSGSSQWDLISLAAGSVPAEDSDGSPFPISGLRIRGAQSFCADAQNNLQAVFGTRSSSCVRTVNLTTVPRIRRSTTTTTTTSALQTTSTITGSPSSTPSGPFYIQAQYPDGTIRYVRFNGANAYLVSPSEALGGDNAPDDADPQVDSFNLMDDGTLESYGAYIGTPNSNNGAPFQRYARLPTSPATFVISPDSSMTLNGASSFCANSGSQLLTNYGGTQASTCANTVRLLAVSRVTRAAVATSTTMSMSMASTSPVSTTSTTMSMSMTSTSPVSTTSVTMSMSMSMSMSSPVSTTVSPTSGISSSSSTMSSPTTTSSTPATFFLQAKSVRGGPTRYIRFSGQNAYLISPTEAYGTDPSGNSPTADSFYIDPAGYFRNGLFYVGTTSNSTGAPLGRYTAPATGSGRTTTNPDGTITLNGSSSWCGDGNNELLVNYSTNSSTCTDEYLISAVEFIDPSPDSTTTSSTTFTQTLPFSSSTTVNTLTTSGPSSTASVSTSSITDLSSTTSGSASSTLTSSASSSSTTSLTSGTASTTGVSPFPTVVIPGQPFYLAAVNPLTGNVRYIKFIGDQATLVDTMEAMSGNSTGGADLFLLSASNNTVTTSSTTATTSAGSVSSSGSVSGTLLNGVLPVGPDSLIDGARIRRFPGATTTQGVWTLQPNGTLTLAGANSLYLDTAFDLLADFNAAAPDCATYVLQVVYSIPATPPSSSGTLCPATVPPTSSTSGLNSSTSVSTTSGVVSTTGVSTTITSTSTSTSITNNPSSTSFTSSSSSVSSTSSIAPSATPFYIYAVNPATGQRRYLRLQGSSLVAVDPNMDTAPMSQYLVDSLGFFEVVNSAGNVTTPGSGTNSTLPNYVALASMNGSQPLIVQQSAPTSNMTFKIGPDRSVSMNGVQSFCTDANSEVIANYDATQGSTCQQSVLLFTADSVVTSTTSSTTTMSSTADVSSTSSVVSTTSSSSASLMTTSGLSGTCTVGACTTTVTLPAFTTTTTVTVSDGTTVQGSTVSGTTSSTALNYVTITTTSGSVSATSTLNNPFGTISGTVLVIVPTNLPTTTVLGYVTITTTSGSVSATSTLNTPSGTISGTVLVILPTAAATTTLGYVTITTTLGSVSATSTVNTPSGSISGTVLVIVPTVPVSATPTTTSSLSNGYVRDTTVYRGPGTLTAEPSTTTIRTPSGSTAGTVTIFYNPKTVTITTTTDGLDTRTVVLATQNGPTSGTIEKYIPNYQFTTITSGTVGSTSVITSASGTVPGSALIVIPTPENCGNRGLQYAIQSNPYSRGLAAADPTYSAFAARAFQTERPQATGLTNYLEVPFISRESSGTIYGNSVGQGANYLGVNHRGYLFAKETGVYTFQFLTADDIALLWIGADAYGPTYNRNNADIVQLYNGAEGPADQQRYVLNVTLAQGAYMPLRVLYANAGYDAQFLLQIYAPDGELITNGTQTNSPYLVQYSCDGTAPMWPTWGTEGSVQRIRGKRY